MPVTLVDQTVQVPKEAKDVADLLIGIVSDIKAGKSTAEILGDALPKLSAAIDGLDQIPAEAKDEHFVNLAALFGAQLYAVLKGPTA